MAGLKYNLIYVAVVVLLPLVPALLLFKVLPTSTAKLGGPFHGFRIDVGGGFAGYLIVLLGVAKLLPTPAVQEMYTLKGRVVIAGAQSGAQHFWTDAVQVSVKPRSYDILPDGSFSVTFAYDPAEVSKTTAILVDAGPCGSVTIPIREGPPSLGAADYGLEFRKEGRLIVARDPITLTPFPGPDAGAAPAAICGVTP